MGIEREGEALLPLNTDRRVVRIFKRIVVRPSHKQLRSSPYFLSGPYYRSRFFCGGGGFSELTGGLSALHCSVYLSPKSETHPIVSEISLLSRFRESIHIAHELWWLCYLRSFNGHYNIIIH